MIPPIVGDVLYPWSIFVCACIFTFTLSVYIFSGTWQRHWKKAYKKDNELLMAGAWIVGGWAFIGLGVWGIPFYALIGLGYLLTRGVRNRNDVRETLTKGRR